MMPGSGPGSEKQFLGQLRQAAGWLGWRCYHTHDSRRSEAGFPDVVLVRPPSVIFAELKTDSGRLTPLQREWLEDLKACDRVEAVLWRPSDWDAAIARLRLNPA